MNETFRELVERARNYEQFENINRTTEGIKENQLDMPVVA